MRRTVIAVAVLTLRLLTAADVRAGDTPTPLFVPDVPPIASLIQVSTPNSAGNVTVTGAPGAVPSGSVVGLVTMETGQFVSVHAGTDGSFTGSTFAPAGTSILVKADPTGESIAHLTSGVEKAYWLSPLPGTILRVADPPPTGSGVPAAGAWRTRFAGDGESGLPAYTFEGSLSTQAVQPGGTLRVQGTIRIVSSVLPGAGAMQARVTFGLERHSGPDGTGSHARSSYASTFLTPTSLPIERFPRFFNNGLDGFRAIDMTRPSADRAEASVDLTLTVPSNFLAGFYRPYLAVNFTGVPVEPPPASTILFGLIDRASRSFNYIRLPIVRVGNPAPPRLFWTLLTDTLSNGTRGTVAVEDRDRFGVASRVLTQSQTFIVPRLNPTSGQPLHYRLEPYVPTVCLDDQSSPGAPSIPLLFPSGQLTVSIRKPDGAVETLGPAPFRQLRVKSLADPNGNPGSLLDGGGGHITDACELSTMDQRFDVSFAQDGLHVITLAGSVQDIWGNVWSGGGTYEVHVARSLSLDTAVLPGTPFEVGDTFTPGVVLSPPVPAEVEVRFRLAAGSDPSQIVERVVRGRANRFGYFHPSAGGIALGQVGEYRVDVTASFRDDQGTLWMGTRTWGGVVAAKNPSIVAHGRRGVQGISGLPIGPQWFFRTQTGISIGDNHIPYPFNAGDVAWLQKSTSETDAATPLISFQDLSGALTGLLRARALDQNGTSQIPFIVPGTFDERAALGELPLFSSRPDRLDPHFDATRVDLWGYSYRSVQRPLVRVREEIGEDSMAPPYWRFFEKYGQQIGASRFGDFPNDIKFMYGASVLRGPAVGQPLYAVYGSLFVLVPYTDPHGGTRTFPPFQGNGGGPSGGPIMTLKGRVIDLFVHLTGVRPGSVLEVGDTFALSGAVGPTLPALVGYTITKPSGQQVSFSGRANRVGYYYRPDHDVVVDEAGVWTVDVSVTYDGVTSAGQVAPPFPTGDVLGTASGRIVVYVVPRGSAPLTVNAPRDTFLASPGRLDVAASGPAGTTTNRAHVTSLMPGFVLESRDLTPAASVPYRYDPVALASDFPNLDMDFVGHAGDLVTISLFGSGPQGQAARVLALHGTELLNLPVPASLQSRIDVTTDRAVYQRSQPLSFAIHLIQGTTAERADIYIGLVHPEGTFDSLLTQGSGVALVPTGTTPTAIAQNAVLPFDFSAPVATRSWTLADLAGTYIAFAVRVRPGQSPFDQANWLSVGYVGVTLTP
jgi:hypothetical protein